MSRCRPGKPEQMVIPAANYYEPKLNVKLPKNLNITQEQEIKEGCRIQVSEPSFDRKAVGSGEIDG